MTANKPKTPTASGISRLLAAEGFKRSERQIGGFGNGYVTEKSSAPGTVIVRHRFWSMGGGNYAPWLAKYAEVLARDFAVRTDPDTIGLIVTTKTEEA